MQIGDKVHVSGTVRDIKEGSVLMACVDDREYWFLEKHVELDVVPEAPPVEPAHALPEAPAHPAHELPEAEPPVATQRPTTTTRHR